MKKLCLSLGVFCLWQATASAEEYSLEDVIAEVNNSVVSISADLGENAALGSGIIISADGYVVTNAHVVEDALNIRLETTENDVFTAKLVGTDATTDIALLKVDKPLNLESARFGDSDDIRVGNQVFAVGNPFGLGNSVSLGIISAKERDIEKGPYDNFLQTDAAINQGNSGGPLFDKDGKIIGMNTAIFSLDGQFSGVGFATPSNTVSWVVEQLKANGKVVRGWLGISVRKVRENNAENASVLVISAMAENSPALAAGLKVGDKLVALGEIPLSNPRLFSLEISKMAPNTEIPVIINRDGKDYDFVLRIAQMPEPEKQNSVADFLENQKNNPLPNFSELNIDKYKIKDAVDFAALGFSAYYDENTREFVIVRINDDGKLAAKGVKIGDRLLLFNGTTIFGVEDLQIKIRNSREKGSADLTLSDRRESYEITVKYGKNND